MSCRGAGAAVVLVRHRSRLLPTTTAEST
uniref:Uncharacterized protein n=1 Tax=Anguilla anguilla TaxID=7936 RepID=A0A0E9RRK2_ANGAN